MTPREDESQSDFMKRCVPEMQGGEEQRSNDQAVAICLSIWRDGDDTSNKAVRQWFKMSKIKMPMAAWLKMAGEDSTSREGGDDSSKDKEKNDEAAEAVLGEVLLYDEIGKSFWDDNTVTAKAFDESLKGLGDDLDGLTVRINSPGGDVYDSIAIHNMLKDYAKATGKPITARIDGIAASGASLIAMAADRIIMPRNTFMLVHSPSAMVMGDPEDLDAVSKELKTMRKEMAAVYAERTGQDDADVVALMRQDRLMAADEATEKGYADDNGDDDDDEDNGKDNGKNNGNGDDDGKKAVLRCCWSLDRLPKAVAEFLKPRFELVSREEMFGEPKAKAPPQSRQRPTPQQRRQARREQQPGNVVSIDQAKSQGRTEYAAYVKEVQDLCILAKAPVMTAQKFITDSLPIAEVRAKLLNARADADARTVIDPYHGTVVDTSATGEARSREEVAASWKSHTDAVNSRMGFK
jgi:ATP-dependent protease ClpP protease subunit